MTSPFVIACIGSVSSEVTKPYSYQLMREGVRPKIVRVNPDTLCFIKVDQQIDLYDESGSCGKYILSEFDMKNSPGLGWINLDLVDKLAQIIEDFDPSVVEMDQIRKVRHFFELEHGYQADQVAIAIYGGELPRYSEIEQEDNLETLELIFPNAEAVYLS